MSHVYFRECKQQNKPNMFRITFQPWIHHLLQQDLYKMCSFFEANNLCQNTGAALKNTQGKISPPRPRPCFFLKSQQKIHPFFHHRYFVELHFFLGETALTPVKKRTNQRCVRRVDPCCKISGRSINEKCTGMYMFLSVEGIEGIPSLTFIESVEFSWVFCLAKQRVFLSREICSSHTDKPNPKSLKNTSTHLNRFRNCSSS